MEKIKIKISQKSIFRYIYLLFLVINLGFAFYLYGFFSQYFYGAIVADQEMIEAQARQSMEDIDIEKFKKIIKTIEAKSVR